FHILLQTFFTVALPNYVTTLRKGAKALSAEGSFSRRFIKMPESTFRRTLVPHSSLWVDPECRRTRAGS
ncbi:hypothetical protein CEXT_248371, partial [Caerostris extrusa]